MVRVTLPIRRWVAGWAAVAIAAGGVIAVGAAPARALGTGSVCAFIEPQGAKFAGIANFGHIGWGYQVAGSSTWIFGSTENPNGSPHIDAPKFNGAWSASGSWGTMLDTFTRQTSYPSSSVTSQSTSPRPSAPYTKYKCESVSNSAVGAANNAASANVSAGYNLPGWNGAAGNTCLDAVYRVFQAYNAQNLPWMQNHPGPNSWFDALDSSTWNQSGSLGETWVNYGTGKYLDVSGPSDANGTVIHQWTYNGGDNQWWFRYANHYGSVFTRYSSNKCMGVGGGSTTPGAAVIEWDCNGNRDQQWLFEATGGYSGSWPLYRVLNYGSGLCLDVQGGSSALGAAMVQEPCSGSATQLWF